MTRTRFSRILPALLAWFLVLALPQVAPAAPPVTQRTRTPITGHYDEAAQALGFTAWGETQHSERAVHVLARLAGDDVVISIHVPRAIPAQQAEIWLRDLSDAMAWWDVDLSSVRLANGTFLSARVRKCIQSLGLGQQRTSLNLPRFQAQLRQLTPLPFLLCVRTSAQELVPSLPAEAQGARRRQQYAFFSQAAVSGKPLALHYGMSRRWRLALITAWVGWALFPTCVFFGLREQLSRDPARSPQERWQAYRRWLKPVWILTVVGAVVTPFFLSLQGVPYLLSGFKGASMPFFFTTVLVPSSWVVVPLDLLGRPLSRALSEKQRQQRVGPLLAGHVAFLAAVHASVPLFLWMQNRPASRPTEPFPWWGKLLVSLIFLSPLLLGFWVWATSTLRWRRRVQGTPPGEADASAELSESIRKLTAALAQPVTRVLVVAQGDTVQQRGAVVLGETAIVLRTVAERLTPPQVATLVAAELLSACTGWKAQLPAVSGAVLGCVGFGSIAWMVLSSPTTTFQPSPAQLILAAGIPLASFPLLLDGRQRRQRQERADLALANASDDPADFFEALRILELVRMEATNLDPALFPVPPHLTERRQRLVRRLGRE